MPYLSTVAAFGFDDFHPPTLLPLYQAMGCRSCQIYRNKDNPAALDDARRIAEDAGLPIDSLHGLFGAAYDPSSPDETTRRKAIDIYRAEGELVRSLGGWGVIVHPAPAAIQPGVILPEQRSERAAPLMRTIEQLARIGEELGVIYLFENVPDVMFIGNDPVELAAMLRKCNHPHARMCLDTGHAHMTGDVVRAAQNCIDLVAYAHIHDNHGQRDSHEIPGQGTIPWNALMPFFAKLPDNFPAMLELFQPEHIIENQLETNLPQQLETWLNVK